MIGMQYKITLPDNFDMNIIRQRVEHNGHKTDGFPDLLFKAYLITTKSDQQETNNEYSPLYVWKNNEGMNRFIFDGFFDNILDSFGWQSINIGVPNHVELNQEFQKSKFVLEIENDFVQNEKVERPVFSLQPLESTGKVLIYNPDKWKYTEFYFFNNSPEDLQELGRIYEILHISM